MDLLAIKKKSICAVLVLSLFFIVEANGYNTYVFDNVKTSFQDPHIVTFEGGRVKRDAPPPASAPAPPPASAPAPQADPKADPKANTNASASSLSDDSNRTVNVTAALPAVSTTATTVPPVASVTQTPLLGVNGSGIRHDVNASNTPRVSDPISINDENITSEVLKNESPEKIKADKNITNLTYDNHNFYNSSFVGNLTYFEEYWANITKPNSNVHAVLSNSHRRATTLRLSFDFPFYGHPLRNITVATGGFIYTGEHVHNWLAATQYIAPLMANFDTTLTNDSYVKMYDDGEKFTAFWENVTLQEDLTKKFTFAATLYASGDIVFAYKSIPIPVQNINDNDHPVKVGISDAYLNDRILFLVRRKTIYEYHRVSFKHYEITNGTILRLTALPTCLQYDSCDSCLNHNTGFDCMWCESIHKCSSGTDRNKQDWLLRNCDKKQVTNASQCSARGAEPGEPPVPAPARDDAGNPAYTTDTQGNDHAVVNTVVTTDSEAGAHAAARPAVQADVGARAGGAGGAGGAAGGTPHSAVGGAVAAFAALALVAGAAAWALYAFKNPHTRSGQLLIKYRPSQWSWRRGEARYTAATIHM